MIKAQISTMKKIVKLVFFTLSFAFVVSVSAPFSITSHAYAAGISSSQSVFDVLLGLGGLNGVSYGESDNGISWDDWVSNGGDKKAYLDLYGGFFDSANQYYTGLGDYLISRINLASTTGTLSLSRSKYKQYLDFLAFYTDGKSVGDSIRIGSVAIETTSYASPAAISISSTGYNSSSGAFLHEGLINIDDIGPFIVFRSSNGMNYAIVPFNTGYSDYVTYDEVSSTGTANRIYVSSYWHRTVGNISTVNVEGNNNTTNLNVFFDADVYTLPSSIYIGSDEFLNLILQYRATGTLSTTTDLYTTVADTVTDVVTSDSTVDESGVISGPINIIINSSDVMSDLLELLQNGDITINDYLASVGAGAITTTLTPSEIKELIESIPATSTQVLTLSDTQSDLITQSGTKVGTLAHIEHAIANAIATATGQALPYPDEDPDYVPPGNPHIQDWDFPSLDPDNPDPGGSEDPDTEDRNRAEDVAAGISVVADLAGDIFDSASGFNLVTTVGYSFVIFSAILGASHFFGALGGRHDDVKSHSLDWNRSERWSSKNTDFKSDW